MKTELKSLIVAVAIMAVAAPAIAQVKYAKGDKLFSVGLGIGGYVDGFYSYDNYNNGYYSAGYGIPVTASLEFFINDAISIGPYAGIAFGNNWFAFDGGARGSYHFSKHIPLGTDKLDLYGSVILGVSHISYDYGANDGDDFAGRFGLTAGARWYFTDTFAVNAEVGWGVTPLLAGVSFKF
jgi:hypothetical protein